MRGADEDKQVTIAMRDSDRPPITAVSRSRAGAIELTWGWSGRACPNFQAQRKSRYMAEYGLPAYDAGVLTATRGMAEYFEACLKLYDDPKSLSNWIMGDFSAHLNAAGLEPQEAP